MKNPGQILCGLSLISVLCAACSPDQADPTAAPQAATPTRPNILLVVVDDMGFSDLGSFGGEIATPNLDRLALEGIRLTNFHAAPMCSPSRAMLLTGTDPHKAGLGNMLEELAPNQKGQPGYEGHLNNRVVTVANRLRDAGYRTFQSGKWHLGAQPENFPIQRGFDRSFSLLSGGASHFADMKPAYAPNPEARASYVDGTTRLTELPANFTYSSQFYADQMIRYLSEAGVDNNASDAPFFAYLAFTAPHWPLQAPAATIAKYQGRYDAGYDVIAGQRLARMKQMGLIPQAAEMVPRAPKGQPWSELEPEQRRVQARAMEVYAAMIDEVDAHTGRVIDYLRNTGQLDNTVVIFISDNGAEGHDLDETWPADLFPAIRRVIDETNDFSYESMGHPGSYTLYGPDWARAAAPSFRLHKGFPTEGGTRVTAFVHYPKAFRSGAISDDLVSILDIAPTLLELAQTQPAGAAYKGRTVEPMAGRSMLGLLTGASAQAGTERVLGQELMGKRAIRAGHWKLVHMPAPWGNGQWQLFDLSTDLAESRDLAQANPARFAQLKALWDAYEQDHQIIIPDWVSGY